MRNEDEFIDTLFDKSVRAKAKSPKITQIPVDKLSLFPDHPFMVLDNGEMETLVESIKENGIMSPLIVRPKENITDEYEVISGHRRLHAAEKAGLKTVPVLIYALDRDAAAIALVDSNLHREHILPSEKARAYKMKTEALKKQGKRTDLTSDQVGPKLTVEEISEDDSASQIKRYIRLTNLIPEILQMVDDSKIAFTPAVELSYITPEQQQSVLSAIQSEDCTPSLSQAQQMHRMSQMAEGLTDELAIAVLSSPKPNQKEKLRIPLERISSFFPNDYTAKQIEDEIVKLCEARFKRKQRDKDVR